MRITFNDQLKSTADAIESFVAKVEEYKKHSEHTKVVEIPYHPENSHESFSEALTCLSHALEAVDMNEEVEPHLSQKLYEMIGEALNYGTLVEQVTFGGDFDVKKKDKK
jgi:truncated hemoglobin YjbI